MSFDKEAFTKHLREHAKPHSQGKCAKAVRQALETAGAQTRGHPVDAKLYGPTLERNGFVVVAVTKLENYVPIKGDIVVFDSHPGGNASGHIQAFDGRGWVSDLSQRGFWPGAAYNREDASYVVYRR